MTVFKRQWSFFKNAILLQNDTTAILQFLVSRTEFTKFLKRVARLQDVPFEKSQEEMDAEERVFLVPLINIALDHTEAVFKYYFSKKSKMKIIAKKKKKT